MSAAPPVKPRIAIVGAGNLARSLAPALRESGYGVEQVIARAGGASLRQAKVLAGRVKASVTTSDQANIHAEVVWFCVPDSTVARAAEKLADAADWRGKVALHSSGALSSDELAVLRRRGAKVASVHPLMTFVRESQPALVGVPFAIEGDRKAVATVRAIVLNLGGKPFAIAKQNKTAYHAWGMFASPLLTALLAATEDVASAAGVRRKLARERMLPILKQTLANYARLGPAESFSGPIARGDVATVQQHLKVLRKLPKAREIYIALARAALRTLPAKSRAALQKPLKERPSLRR
jgi:predicted short-subunit dehydrogenase-like oxidoreductase (DUF2520 family)